VGGSSARRLQLIEQQLRSRDSLIEIIDKYDIYSDIPDLRPIDKVDLLRQDTDINGVAAVQEGFADDGTISVITFTARMRTPELAQAVASEMAERTRELTNRQRQNQTEETFEFFQNQEDAVLAEIAQLEEDLAAFRAENDLSIQGSLEFRRDEIGSLNTAILQLDRDIIAAQLALSRIDTSQRASTVAREQEELQAQIDSLTSQRGLLAERRAALSNSLQTTPEVERTLARFDRRMGQLQGQLNVIATRRNEAEVGLSLESAARGERLTTIESAPLPEYPYTTSRKRRALMGGVASGMLALALAFLLELRRPIVRTARQMERETGLRPVVSIPDMRPTKARGPKASLSKMWEDRRISGQKGRAARLARQGDLGSDLGKG
jgi:uncharacterized protein involved in exopolysaccharide biosynthesis